jgi:protease-4
MATAATSEGLDFMDQAPPTSDSAGPVPPPLPPPRIAPSAAQPLPPPPGSPPVPPPRRRGRLGCIVGVILGLVCLGVLAVVLASGVLSGAAQSMMSGVIMGPEGPEHRVLEEVISGSRLSTDRKIAVVDVKGIILSEDAFDMAGSRRIGYELAAARRDPQVVAIVLDMDTPGGEVTASDEIYREVRLCSKANIPVVTCMHSLGASGGYFVAAGSDWIVANRLTITGSIGVIIGTLNYAALFTRIGVESEVYKSGQMKDMLRGSRERTDMERAYVQGLVDDTFREFAAVVANGRNRYDTAEDVIASEFGDGRILTGAEALRLGLVDQLGYFDDAVDKAKELADVQIAKVVRYRRPLRFMDLLLGMQARARLGLHSLLPAELRAIQPGRLYFLMPSALP